MSTGDYRINDGHVYAPDGHDTGYWISEVGLIFNPDTGEDCYSECYVHWINGGRIYGADGYMNCWVDGEIVHGEVERLPWHGK